MSQNRKFLSGEITDRYWREVERKASNRNIDFLVTPEEVWKAYLRQNKRCAISGVELEFNSSGYRGIASLDRLDSYKPYVSHNVQWVHGDINIMKRNHTEKYLRYLCNLVLFGDRTDLYV